MIDRIDAIIDIETGPRIIDIKVSSQPRGNYRPMYAIRDRLDPKQKKWAAGNQPPRSPRRAK